MHITSQKIYEDIIRLCAHVGKCGGGDGGGRARGRHNIRNEAEGERSNISMLPVKSK